MAPETGETAGAAAELAARTAYGRLLATLSAQTRDVHAAEDALAEAFAAALKTWPERGVPAAPDAWLLTTARRKLMDAGRRAQTASRHTVELINRIEEAAMDGLDPDMPDPRLGLMFLCAHPAIDRAVRTPLMLQTVLGIDADRIAQVSLLPAATLSQRLVRAKRKIRDAGIPFGIPGRESWHGRLGAVLDAIYAAYTAGWELSEPDASLAREAEWLARLLAGCLPQSGEAKGLLALIVFCEARRDARRSATGAYIPLSDQDTALWDGERLGEAADILARAAGSEDIGRFQLEAAIQSVHSLRSRTGTTDWAMLLTLYNALLANAPSIGGEIARAAVIAEAVGPEDGLGALAALPADRVAGHAPFLATRGHILAMVGRVDDARADLRAAADLTQDPAVAAWLRGRADQAR